MKFLIIKATNDGYVTAFSVDNRQELGRWSSLFRQDILDKLDDFASKSNPGDCLRLDRIYYIVNWSGELFQAD